MLLKEISLDVAGMTSRDEKIKILDRALRRFGDNISEEMNRRLLAEEEAYKNPFNPKPIEDVRSSPLPQMSKGRLVTLALAAAAGYWYLPQYTRLLPNSSILVGAGLMWGFWLLWDNWLGEWF